MILQLARLTRDEVAEYAENGVAVVPIGSTEQHGPHLPMLTDTLLVEAVVRRALDRLADGPAVFVQAPTIPIGCSDHHLFAAAVSLRTNTLRAVLTDVCDSLVGSGFRRIVIVNGHGGNDECVTLAVKELVLRHPVAAAACSYWQLAGGSPGHAGRFETSLMLAAHPDLVRTDRLPRDAADPPPVFDQQEIPGLVAQRSGEWARVGGVTDAPVDATSDDGDRRLDDLGSRLADALSWMIDRNPPPERGADA